MKDAGGWNIKRIKQRLELVNIPTIPSLCLCKCNGSVWGGKEWINGHNSKGINNPMYGKPTFGHKNKHHSTESCIKISENHANVSGENNPMYGVHRYGELNPNWMGGVSFDPYCEKWTPKLREDVRLKFNHRCFICDKDQKYNITKTGKVWKLSVHHIDYDKGQGCNGKGFILAPLCLKCHPKTNKNRKEWIKNLTNKLMEIEYANNRKNNNT